MTKEKIELAGRDLTVESGRMAKQANGSVFVTYGKTVILVTATMSKEAREGTDFFPLTVDYIEKMYAAGKIPGGFFKREARPSTNATLSARLIDRAIRPLFPEGFRNAVHVVLTILSYDGINNPVNLGIFGASLALMISDIPFNGPVANVSVGLIDGEFVINTKQDQIEKSTLELDVAGTISSIVMIEAGAIEITEDVILDAIYKGHETIKELNIFQNKFTEKCGKDKIEVKLDVLPEDIIEQIKNECGEDLQKATNLQGKAERSEAIDNIKQKLLDDYAKRDGEDVFAENEALYKKCFDHLFKQSVRESILNNHRVDGRGLDDIRPITCEVDILPMVHGSALFTRGETQSLGTITLGTGRDEQIIDGLEDEYKKKYYLHYNFPPFSVGEAGFMRGPGRRELGHGALAERALLPVLPKNEDFPYTIRAVSEILESNGSSSMATVCSGTLAMMAGGVPIKAPVAGIANGLIMDGDKYVVLTDIMGLEDHLGDMDFKVTGTKDGITAMQMDIKIEGISKEIMEIALAKAKIARDYILDKIVETIAQPRTDLSECAPKIVQMKINPDKIGAVIGSGGKMIKSIIEKTKVDLNIDDDGTVSFSSNDNDAIQEAKNIVTDIVSDPIMNAIYEGVVKRIEVFGAFVNFMSETKDGLVHISQMHNSRINKVEDVVKLGDKVRVKFIGLDRGKIKLTMKGVDGNPEPDPSAIQKSPPRNYNRDHKKDSYHDKKRDYKKDYRKDR
ncbi:MAG: polyribonucleotide nucleotidyltransferase [Candidatus Cloacimonetes bacterium]|nr:polyribonucleotide nucleotidyltransferase [Candidatus Cloacimonadota bacterium]